MLIEENKIKIFANHLGLSHQELIKQSLSAFFWNKLQSVKIQVFTLQKKYKIEKFNDFDKLYEEGLIEEANTWEDVQKFDRLSYEEELYEKFLKDLV